MFTLTYKEINGDLIGALTQLRTTPMPTKTAYTVGKIIAKVDQVMKLARDEHKELLTRFVHLDAQGNIKTFPPEIARTPDGLEMKTPKGEAMMTQGESYRFLSPEMEKEYKQTMEKFLSTQVTIDQQKVSIYALGNAEISPSEIDALDPILTTLAMA